MSHQIYKSNKPIILQSTKNKIAILNFIKLAKFIMLLIVIGIALIAVVLWSGWELPLTSPISTKTHFSFSPYSIEPLDDEMSQGHIVYGFLPYWNLNNPQINQYLTHLSYFALTIGKDGALLIPNDEESQTGYKRLSSDELDSIITKAINQNISLELVVKQFDPAQTKEFLTSLESQQNFFDQIGSLILAYPFTGINVDIEINTNAKELQPNLTEFMANFRQYLDESSSDINLSIDIYSSAASGQNIWDLAKLKSYVDYFIIMAYDYHRSQSSQAGPVSPLLGGEVYQNINQHLKEVLELVPPQQIILGIPFYGYEWRTTNRSEQANTYPDTGGVASYKRISSLLEQKSILNVQEHWNERALSPYLSYEKDGETFTVYYENPRSLTYKLDYVRQLHLAGIAIWALGYEGDTSDLWDTIRDRLNLKTE